VARQLITFLNTTSKGIEKVNVNSRKRAVIATGVIAAMGLALLPAAGAFAAPQTNGSAGPIRVVNADTAEDLGGASQGWETQVTFTPDSSSVDTVYTEANRFAGGADSTGAYYFVSARGDELDKSKWYGIQNLPILDHGVWLPTLGLYNLADGDRAGDISDVKTNGGEYSYGIVFTKENGNQIADIGGYWVDINVTAGSGAWTYVNSQDEGPSNVAPAITTQPANANISVGGGATFTAAASGTPTPTVQWESSTGGAWSAISGATSASYSVTNATLAQSGTQYRAVFTNSAGAATTTAATLTVENVAPTSPTEPTSGSTAGFITLPEGETTANLVAGAGNGGKTLTAWAWPGTENLGAVTLDASGNGTLDVSGLEPGTYKIALAESDFSIVIWGSLVVPEPPLGENTTETDLTVDVTTSNRFELTGVNTSVDLGDVRRGQTSTAVALGAFTVIDDRDLLPGWTLNADVDDFDNAGDVVSKAALGLAPKKVGGAVAGISLGTAQTAGAGTYAALFAQGDAGSTTLEAGTQFDADLTFKAPTNAKKGTYSSTLTLTLVSK
jgi:hypothetical protein